MEKEKEQSERKFETGKGRKRLDLASDDLLLLVQLCKTPFTLE